VNATSPLDPPVEHRATAPDSVSGPPTTAEIQAELQKILSSRTFRAAEAQRGFLRYVAEEVIAGRGNTIKEYLIGVEAFGRGEAFDPRLDPIVRTQARKLRARLAKYYETEGCQDPVRIELPKGSYVPSFERLAAPAGPVASSVPAEIEASGNDGAEQHPAPLAARSSRGLWFLKAPRFQTALAAAGVIFCALVVFGVWRAKLGTVQADAKSIAVLPLANLSDQKQDEFLSDGLTDELIGSFQQVQGLQVVAHMSAFRFKEKTQDIQEIGRKLHVRAVLVGSIRKSGDRLRINVQLDDTADGAHLWSGSYDRAAGEARTVQWEIARAVTDVLGLGVPARSAPALVKTFPGSNSPTQGAYQNYLKGLYFWNKLTPEGLRAAAGYFEQAIADDPSFAKAYSALAHCYVMEPMILATPVPEVISKIRATASRALELDSRLGEPHFDLAVSAEYEFDWANAEKEFRRGLELSPENVIGHLWYAKFLALVGRPDEVLVQRRIAADLDPVSPYAVQSVGGYMSVTGHYDEAIEQFRNALALQPDFGFAHQGLGMAYLLKGMHSEAIEEFQIASRTMTGPRRVALLGWAYAQCGQEAAARQILNDFLEQARRGPFPALAIAQIYIGLGDKDSAFAWLNKAVDQRDLDETLLWDSPYQPLRSDPRFRDLLRRMKLT